MKYTQKMESTRKILADYDKQVEKVAKDKYDELVEFIMKDDEEINEEIANNIFAPTLENNSKTPRTVESSDSNRIYEDSECICERA